MNEYSQITELNGIGEKTAALFHRVGVYSLWDLLTYYPRDYEEFEEPVKVQSAVEEMEDMVFSFDLTISSEPTLHYIKSMKIVELKGKDDTGVLECTWFNMPFLKKTLHCGERYIFRGRLSQKGIHHTLVQPQIYKSKDYMNKLHSLQPIYAVTKGLTGNGITKMVRQTIEVLGQIPDYLSPEFRQEMDFLAMEDAIKIMHFPTKRELVVKARERLVFDEFFFFLFLIRQLKEKKERAENNYKMIPVVECTRIVESLPYALTGAQERTNQEIMKDLYGEHAMNRLVQGDVGSGKTIIAILALVTTAVNGYQGVLMAPTEVLAIQHMETISALLSQNNISISCVLLTGSMTASQKREAKKQIADGSCSIVIGTHALIQDSVSFHNLALVITDEQHRFGVKQRENLAEKTVHVPHVLVMSATPIPRTLAIIIYGDLDISLIDELPAQRLPIKNCVVGPNFRPKAYHFIRNEVQAGRQALVVCPMVEDSEQIEAENVIDYTKRLREALPNDFLIEYLHGKMRPREKNEIMERFASGEIQVLVSTTVIEVGINVPNTTVMMVENAERFGLAQLHQLRGRVGRGEYQSYCIFMCGKNNKAIKERLDILNHSNDGFKIAEEDLKLRGPGDLFGFRQSGDMNFKIGNIFTDAGILKKASEYVDFLFDFGIHQEQPSFKKLYDRLSVYRQNQFDKISL